MALIGKKARRLVYCGGNRSKEESDHYVPPETQMEFETAEIPLQSYSNRSRYLHRLMNLIEQLLIGSVDRRTSSLRVVRLRLMDFWLSRSYLCGARKTESWDEHAQVIWACICRISSLLMDDRDYNASLVEGLEDRIPREIVPHLDDPVPETIIKIDMISFWRSVRNILEYVSTSERARYTTELIGHLNSLVLSCSRFMTRTFPVGAADKPTLYQRHGRLIPFDLQVFASPPGGHENAQGVWKWRT